MIISTDAEKALDKIQHPFTIKTHWSDHRGNISQHKAIYDKPTANIILNGEKPKVFPLKSGTRIPTHHFYSHSIGSPGHNNQTKRNEGIPYRREEVKLSLYVDDMILYTENPKDSA